MKKTSKRYTVTSDAVNCYGYRVLTSGIDISQYQNNPILLWMHIRANGNSKDQILALGNAVDLRKENDKYTCYLAFDETDSFAMQIYNKYENGTLNMLSLGAKPLEWSDEPALMLPGQTGPTFTKTLMVDISCVDIGGNPDSVPVQLYDLNDNMIALSSDKSALLLQLSKKASMFPGSNHSKSTVDIVTNGVLAGKLTDTMATALLNHPNDDEGVKVIHDFVKRAKINPDVLAGKIPRQMMPLVPKSWKELKASAGDGTKDLKAYAPEVYKAKHFEEYGRMPAERNGKPL